MSLTNINYGAGQDQMNVVFDKCNNAIDAINELAGGTQYQTPYKASSTDFDFNYTSGDLSSGTITAATGWASSSTVKLLLGGWVEINADLTISTGGTTTVGTIASAYRPAVGKRFTISDYNGSEGASVLMVMNIATDGTITISKQADGTKPANRTSLIFTVNYNIL